MPRRAQRRRAPPLRERLETALDLGYEQLYVLTAPQLAALVLRRGGRRGPLATRCSSAGDRLAMLIERIDELSLEHHDFGGRPNALLAGFVRRIDRLKAELVGPEEYAALGAIAADPTHRRRRSSTSSPRSTPPTSGCCSSTAPATTGT